MPPDEERSSSLLDRLHVAGKKARISQDGRILSPAEVVPPDAYRPESKGRGLHAIVERAHPWRSGKPVPLEGALGAATILLLWYIPAGADRKDSDACAWRNCEVRPDCELESNIRRCRTFGPSPLPTRRQTSGTRSPAAQ